MLKKSEEWSECCTYGGRVPSTVGSEDAVELSNEILKKEHGWYREQQSVNELIVVRKKQKGNWNQHTKICESSY